MNDFVDLFLLVLLLVNETEVIMHKSEHVGLQVIKFIDPYFCIEDALEPEEWEDEIVEHQVLFVLPTWLT